MVVVAGFPGPQRVVVFAQAIERSVDQRRHLGLVEFVLVFIPVDAQVEARGQFELRLKMPAGYRIARHWHPSDEHVTVIEGELTLDMGDAGQAHSMTFHPGDYVLLPAHMPHMASTTSGAVVQVHAMGPFELNYLDPKDDPRKRAAAK